MTPILPGHRPDQVADAGTHRERYALACATVSVSAQVLLAAQAFAGQPGVVLANLDLPVSIALAQVRSAVGAVSIVAGKLLAECREEAAQISPAIGRPLRPEHGVTTVGDGDRNMMIRALASALTEASAASRYLAAYAAPPELQTALAELIGLMERTAAFLGLQ